MITLALKRIILDVLNLVTVAQSAKALRFKWESSQFKPNWVLTMILGPKLVRNFPMNSELNRKNNIMNIK